MTERRAGDAAAFARFRAFAFNTLALPDTVAAGGTARAPSAGEMPSAPWMIRLVPVCAAVMASTIGVA